MSGLPEHDQTMREAERVLRSGSPDAISAGGALLRTAAELGSGEALALLAHFTASGVLGRAEWDRSVDLLQRSAEAGWTPARKELRVLARGAGDTPKAMRRKVDIHAWVAPRPIKTLSDSPRMSVIPSFMTARECAWMIELGRPKLKRAKVYGGDARGSEVVTGRTNTSASLLFHDVDVVTVFLTARMANSIGLPTPWFEPPTILHYAPGEQFRQHFDFLSVAIPGQAAELERGGQRIATLLVYLNDDYDAGETEFPRLRFRHKGKAGDAFVFGNVLPSGEPDVRTLHAGTPPTRGEKWVLSQWIRERNTT